MEEYNIQKKHDKTLQQIDEVRREIRHLQYQFEYDVLDPSQEEKLLDMRDTLEKLEKRYDSLMDVSSKVPDVWASYQKKIKKQYKKAKTPEKRHDAWFTAKGWFESTGHFILPYGPRFSVTPLQNEI